MARELVSVSIQNEDLVDKLSYHDDLQQKYTVSWFICSDFMVRQITILSIHISQRQVILFSSACVYYSHGAV